MWVLSAYALVTLLQIVSCQRGLLFGTDKPSTTIQFPPVSPAQAAEGARENVLVTMTRPMHFFQQKNINQIRIFRDGMVTIGANNIRPGCPQKIPGQRGPGIPAILPFWMQVTSGTITLQQFTSAGQLSSADQTRIVADISRGFKETLNLDDVNSIVIVTWLNTKNIRNSHRGELRNTFQLAIVSTAVTSYAIFVYRVMDVFWVNEPNRQNAVCQENAVTGIRGFDTEDDFSLSAFFRNERRDLVAYFSNIDDFQNLGRYAMKLTKNIKQPIPPTLECTKNNPDPIICLRSSWFAVETTISSTFCKFREAGIYSYPLTCNQIVTCGNSRSFQLRVCPEGTNFNPQLGTCDFISNFECIFPMDVRVITKETMKNNGTRPQIINQQKIIHNNFCFLRGDGWYPDPTRCNFYLVCSNSRGVIFKCPGNLFWQVTRTGRGFCNYKKPENCKDVVRPPIQTTSTSITTTATATTPTASKTTTTRKPPTYYPYHTIKTVKHLIKSTRRPAKSTQRATSAQMTTTTTTTTTNKHDLKTSTTTKSHSEINSCKDRYGLYPDPMSCQKYLVCVHGRNKPIRMKCPANLYFYSSGLGQGYCTYPTQVCCSNGDRSKCS